MECKSPTFIKIPGTHKILRVPCKKCIPCKINKTSEWTMRLLMELNTNEKAVFLTLTYNNDNLPTDRSLSKDEISNFNKAFRQRYEDKMKFFACGEYGDNPERLTFFGSNVDPELIKRPHYHSILFGVDNSLSTREMLYDSWQKCDSWKFFGKTWYKTVGNVTKDSCQYVAGYCQKKLFGDKAEEEYQGKLPPFQLQSHQIGEKYFLDHIKEYVEDGFINFNGVYHSIPEVWKKKFDIHIPQEKVCENLKRAVDRFNLKNGTSLNVSDVYRLYHGSYNVGSVYEFVAREIEELHAYSDYVDIKNNLRRKGQLIL